MALTDPAKVSFLFATHLESEDGRLDELERAAVDLDETLAGLELGETRGQHLFNSLQFPPSSNQVPLPNFPPPESHCTLAMATAVAVRFLPKQATLCVDDMAAVFVGCADAGEKGICRDRALVVSKFCYGGFAIFAQNWGLCPSRCTDTLQLVGCLAWWGLFT